jgi:hypothetical protein
LTSRTVAWEDAAASSSLGAPQSTLTLFSHGKTQTRRCLQQAKQKQNMKAKYLSVIGLIGIAILGVCCKSGPDKPSTNKHVSAADKAAIKEIFKGADAKNYRIWFDGGKDTMGSKKLTLADVKQAGKTGIGTGAILLDDDIGICYKGTVPWRVIEGQLGKEKVLRLNTIIARYQ